MRHAQVDTTVPVSQIGLGTWQFGSREWCYGSTYDSGEAAAIVKRALELGVTLFDTAEIYGGGRSERILGRALRDADADPSTIFLATKIFPALPISPVVEQRALASASRLGARHIDLYQVHQANPIVHDQTTMRGMQTLLEVGIVGHVGVSNYSLARWQRADAALAAAHREALAARDGRDDDADIADWEPDEPAPVVLSNQVHYNLVHREPEAGHVPFAERERRLLIAYSPLAQGFLSARHTVSSRVTGVRSANSLFLRENIEAARPLFATLRDVADAHGATPAQIALAWVIRSPQVAAIPGASSVEQLESNVAAAELRLADDEIAALSAASDAFRPISGWHAAPKLARSIYGSFRN